MRERLFNWLQGEIVGARCLDLFAGSGALGLEAASRGASHVTLVESNPMAARHLADNVERLKAGSRVQVIQDTVENFLRTTTESFDLVFMDPPFTDNLMDLTCWWLTQKQWNTGPSWLYIESPAAQSDLPDLPGWPVLRQQDQGAVRSTLLHRKACDS